MMEGRSLHTKHWYLVSYDSLRTSLVGGNRMYRLNQFLRNENIKSSLISRDIESNEGILIPENRIVVFTKRLLKGSFFIDPSIWWAWRVYNYIKKCEPNSVWLTSAPPFGVSLVGLLGRFLKKDFFWIADFRDSWTLNPLYKPFPFGKLFSVYFEKIVFKKADLIIFNTDTDKNNYCKKHPELNEKSIVVRNGYSKLVFNKATDPNSEIIKIIYSGGAYPGAEAARNIVKFLNSVNLAGLNIFCDYYGEYHPVLEKSTNLEYKGRVPQNEIPYLLSNYRFGLIYLQEECLGGGRVTQKFYDYIGSGVLPIVINPSKEMTNMMVELQTGVALFSKTDLRSIVPILSSLDFSKNTLLNSELTHEYSNKYQFEKLLEFVD